VAKRAKGNVDDEGEVVALADARSDKHSESLELEIRIDDVPLHRTPSRVARSLRYLLARGDLPKRFSVTSAIRGEGVTSVSRSMAALIANDWLRSTCWVDLNWWAQPPAHESELFKTTIVDVIAGRKISADLPVATSVPGLSFVAGGEVPASTRSRLPRSEALAGVVEELGHWFDYLVLDLPPVLTTSDTLSLGALTDGYLLVVRQRATTSTQVAAALSAMNAVPCLGTVLNGSRTRIPSWLHTSNELWALGDS
jgi:Mrp family chromosome partitioning ATPase